MKILVCMKQVPDSETRVKIASDGKTIDLSSVNMVINPFDEFAIEEGIRIREKSGGEVTVLTLGVEKAETDIRKALAMGADKGILLKTEPGFNGDVAHALAEEVKSGSYDLILLGKQAIDDDSAQIAQMIAEKTDLPCITNVIKFDLQSDGKTFLAEREIEGGKEQIECSLPVVIGTQKGINEPRLPNMKGIMAAKKKPLEKKPPALIRSPYEVISLELPPPRAAGKIVGKGPEAIPELVRLLHEEAKVL